GSIGYYRGSGYYGGLYGGWGYPWYGGYYPGWYGSPGYHYRPPYRPPHRPRPDDVDRPGGSPPSAVSRLRSAQEIEQLREQRRLQGGLSDRTGRPGVAQPPSRLRAPDQLRRSPTPARRFEAPVQRVPRAAPVENRLRGDRSRASPGAASAPRPASPARATTP